MKSAILAIAAFATLAHAAQQSSVVTAVLQPVRKLSGTIQIDSVGGSVLVVNNGASTSVCRLRILNAENKPKAVIPVIRFDFRREACKPALAENDEREVLPDVILTIEKADAKSQPVANARWLRSAQPAEATLKAYYETELARDIAKWKEHAWGN
jgi:hypothetical protein